MSEQHVGLHRLISGEEIIGLTDLNKTGDSVHITKPIVVAITSNPTQKVPRLAFMAWVPYFKFGDDTVTIDRRHIMFSALADPQMEDEYRKAVGLTPRIVTEPTKKFIMP